MNVIDLSYIRAINRSTNGARLLLVTNRHSSLLLTLDCPWEMTPIFTEVQLEEQRQGAMLCLIDARVKWMDPVVLTPRLCEATPVVWLAASGQRRQKSWIRNAYSCGVSDIIYDPYPRDELEETISVLLRLQSRIA
ncbi:MAG: hypothetical protein HYR96_15960 [Deltaproteobacteria bacterium]|nr:hypothetical protein [Deltaproteobacteria bacterium]MBI3293297.1 hypothetical protein [Deltaproteobacteria bacterium]